MSILATIAAPFRVLKDAINKVPFIKYALAVAGIGGAIAIIKSFGIENYTVPVLSLLVFLGLMVLLFVFSALTKSNDKKLRFAGYLLVYTVVLVTCASAILLATSIFLKVPDTFKNIISGSSGEPQLSIKDLGLSVALLKKDSTFLPLKSEEIGKAVKIDPPVNLISTSRVLLVRFDLPEKYLDTSKYLTMRFGFGKEITKYLSGDLLCSNTEDNASSWSSEIDPKDGSRYYSSDQYPNKLVFKVTNQNNNP